jgi:ribose 5-phosphate isomerase B
LSRAHNDANVLSIGQRLVPDDEILGIVDVWLETPFDGGRHIARIRKIDEPWTGRHAPGQAGPAEHGG